MTSMILAGDIGGTNTRLAIFDDSFVPVREKVFQNAGRSGLTDVAREFIQWAGKDAEKLDRACFGVAGPVANGAVALTNIGWHMDEKQLSSDLGIARVALINDLMANAEGISRLSPDKLVLVNQGEERRGNRAVIAAGTGLGEAGLFWDENAGQHRAWACEGGHADFAPKSDREIALLKFVQAKQNFVSWETILSGPGLRHIYDFLISPNQLGPGAALANADPKPSEISAAGMEGKNSAAVESLDMFVRFYGSEAGNLALKTMAVGGVYIGGGIAPKIISKLKETNFFDNFWQKGPDGIRSLLKKMPIYVINFELCALYGAANYASRL